MNQNEFFSGYIWISNVCFRGYDTNITLPVSLTDSLWILGPQSWSIIWEEDGPLGNGAWLEVTQLCLWRFYLVPNPQSFLFPDRHDLHMLLPPQCPFTGSLTRPLKDEHALHLACYTNPKMQNRCPSSKLTKVKHYPWNLKPVFPQITYVWYSVTVTKRLTNIHPSTA